MVLVWADVLTDISFTSVSLKYNGSKLHMTCGAQSDSKMHLKTQQQCLLLETMTRIPRDNQQTLL